ncbi:hypothetical protein [Nonomuraea basaltis]|uniref:hypothetical protein n=1 Tax=Nonomuraea basaltis TaxID=2495887 RepID=UPI00110C6CBD|nr:hypothetical protein [Nonomuraea basaltis]TMR99549.1 hypothetical protein EJK15_06980 [Nonomuraea basaltis]
MPSTAEQVIARVLKRKTPTAEAVLDELARAGCTIIDPQPIEPPVWLPKDNISRATVQQVADLIRQGKTVEEIVSETGKSKRMVDRYVSAAIHLGWVRRRPQRKRATRKAQT